MRPELKNLRTWTYLHFWLKGAVHINKNFYFTKIYLKFDGFSSSFYSATSHNILNSFNYDQKVFKVFVEAN